MRRRPFRHRLSGRQADTPSAASDDERHASHRRALEAYRAGRYDRRMRRADFYCLVARHTLAQSRHDTLFSYFDYAAALIPA